MWPKYTSGVEMFYQRMWVSLSQGLMFGKHNVSGTAVPSVLLESFSKCFVLDS